METDISEISEQPSDNGQLWVDLYKPRRYMELLSDESTNRAILRWLKLWDKVVFNRNPIPKSKLPQKQAEAVQDFDDDGRPHFKVALICGPPGLGNYLCAMSVIVRSCY